MIIYYDHDSPTSSHDYHDSSAFLHIFPMIFFCHFRWDTVAEVLCGCQQICQDRLGLGGCCGGWGISFLFFFGEILTNRY
jgi:hypothetical protein